MTKAKFIEMMTDHYGTFKGLREGPNNRSYLIDQINNHMGVPLGSAYCLSGLWYGLDEMKVRYGFTVDLPRSAGCQKFAMKTKSIYWVSTPQEGDYAIYKSTVSNGMGHACYVKKPLNETEMRTYEFNTNAEGARDGDGFHEKTRVIKGSGHLKLLTFIRVPSAVLFDGKPLV